MITKIPIKQFNRVVQQFGASVRIMSRGFVSEKTRAFVQRYSRRGVKRFYDTSDIVGVPLGELTRHTLVGLFPYSKIWDSDAEIRVLYHGKTYIVAFDNPVIVADEPFYVWAILEPVAKAVDDYDNIGGED